MMKGWGCRISKTEKAEGDIGQAKLWPTPTWTNGYSRPRRFPRLQSDQSMLGGASVWVRAVLALLGIVAAGGAGGVAVVAPPFSGAVLNRLVETTPFDGKRYLQADGDYTLFQHQAETWLQAIWNAVRAKLPPVLARLAPGNGNSTAAGNSSTLDLASLFARALVPSSFTWHPETLVAGLWNVSVPTEHVLHNGMTIMSGGNRDPHGSHASVIDNHRAFAQKLGYAYWWHSGSMVEEQGWQPYWSKIAQLRKRMQRHPEETAFVWIDDDIVLTNFAVDNFQAALDRYPNASVLVTKDAWVEASALNTGIIIIRNDERAHEIMEELWLLATELREDGVSLAHASQRLCLHEQEALATLAQGTRCGSGGIQVLPQRGYGEMEGFNLNTFLRWSHFDGSRDQLQIYDHDSSDSQWRRGDFAGHCTGLSYLRRGLCVRTLLASVVDDDQARVGTTIGFGTTDRSI